MKAMGCTSRRLVFCVFFCEICGMVFFNVGILAGNDNSLKYSKSIWDPHNLPEEHRLYRKLMKEYEPSVRPVRNSSKPVMVKMGITLTQIFDMDEKNQVLVTNIWLDQQWYDEYLTWNQDEFPSITKLRIPSEKIWKPDIVLYNNAADFADKMMPALAMVKSDGEVFWPVPTKLKSSCKIDVTYFPFDSQICILKFGSWTYDGFQVELDKLKNVDLDMYVENGEWKLKKTKALRNNIVYTCCPEPYYDVTFVLYLERRILYFIYHVIYPCIMMSTLTLFVFCLPPDSGEKIALGITVLLAFSVLMLSIAEKLPETSESVPLISIYLTTVMSMTSVSVMMTVFVLNLHHRGPNKSQVPNWMKRLMKFKRQYFSNQNHFTKPRKLPYKSVKNLECLLSSINNKIKTIPFPKRNSMENNQNHVDEYLSKFQTPIDMTRIKLNSFQTMETEILTGSITANHEFEPMILSESDNRCMENIVRSNSISVSSSSIPCFSCKYQINSGSHTAEKAISTDSYLLKDLDQQEVNKEILNALNKMLIKHEIDESKYNLIQEWREVAEIVDKLLFWIYLFSTSASTFIILIIAPVFGIIPINIIDPMEIRMNLTGNFNNSQII